MCKNSRKSEKVIMILFVAATIALFFLGINNRDLWTPDEPRVAEIGREMAESGNFVVPMLNRRPFLEQPPLFYATLALVFKIAGYATDGLARIPVAIYSLLGAFATFLIARNFFGTRVGIFSAFILATSFEYFRVSRWVVVDSALSCFVYFAMWAFLKAYFGSDKEKSRYYMLFNVFVILAFFVKGFIGIGVPFVSLITFLLLDGNVKEIKKMRLITGISLFLITTGFWVLGLLRQGGFDYLRTFFVDNNLMRFLPGGTSGHHHPFYYYLKEFPAGFFPWVVLLVPAILYVFLSQEAKEKREILFLKCYFIAGFVLFSLASTKRVLYLLPIFAPASIIVAFYIEHLMKDGIVGLTDKIFVWFYGLVLLAAGAIFVPVTLKIAKVYGVEIIKRDIIILFVTSFATVLFSLFSLFWLKRRNVQRFFIFSTTSLFILLVFLLLWVCPYVNKYKSFKPFVERVVSEVPHGASLYCYKSDETIRGFFPFYTGQYLKEIEEKEDLRELSREKGVYVIIRDKNDKRAKDLSEMGFEKVFGIKRDKVSLALFRSAGSP